MVIVPVDFGQPLFNEGTGDAGGVLVRAGEQVGAHPAPGQVHGVGVGEQELVVLAALFGVHILGQHAHDGVGVAAHADFLPQGFSVKIFLVEVGANDAHLLLAQYIHILHEPPFLQSQAADGGVVLSHAQNTVGLEGLPLRAHRHPAHRHIGADGGEVLGVLVVQLIHILRADPAGGAAVPHVDLNHVRAHGLKLVVEHLLHTVAQRDDDDDGGHADNDAQHGEHGAHLAGEQGLDGQNERLLESHQAVTSSSSATLGCTTAWGSRASPS